MVDLSIPIPNHDQAPTPPPRTDDSLAKVRPYIERLLGWDQHAAVSQAMESIAAFVECRSQITIVGHFDMAPVGEAIHRRTLGQAAPFIVLDSRRRNCDGDFRSPASQPTVAESTRTAKGGTVFIRGKRFVFRSEEWMDRAIDVRFMVHTTAAHTAYTLVPRPIRVRSLEHRSRVDRARIAAETIPEVQAELEISIDLPAEHREWIALTCSTLHDVEKAAARLLASLSCRFATGAAAKLGCESISLKRWLRRAGFDWPPLVPPMVPVEFRSAIPRRQSPTD